jgi:PAS domain S-box-containing protein
MRRSRGSRAAIVALCAALASNVAVVDAAEIADVDAVIDGRLRTVARSNKPRPNRGRSTRVGAAAVNEALASELTLEACATQIRHAQALLPTLDVDAGTPIPDFDVCTLGRPVQPAARTDQLVAVLRNLVHEIGCALTPESQVSRVLCSMADAMHEGLAVCDHRATIIYVNNSLCRMLGREGTDMVGRSAAGFFPGMSDRFVHDSGRSSFETEWHNRAAGGALFKVAIHYIGDADGERIGCFAVVRDFSRRNRAEIALRRSESELRLLSAQLLAAHETERRRIARGLHDGIGQSLGGIKFGLESCVARLSSESPDSSTENMRQLVSKVQAVIEDVRRVAMNLRPSVLDHLGIAPTIEWFCREFNAIYPRVRLEAEVDVCEDEISAPVKTAMYRIIQEACNNAVKHAQAGRIALRLKQEGGHVELSITDDGIGFDAAEFIRIDTTGRGLGLASMRERAEATAGRFRLESKQGLGTVVRATWPSYCPRVKKIGSGVIRT